MTELQPVQLITWQGQKYSVKTQDYKVSELRKQAALLLGAPSERVQLLQQGKILQDGDDVGLAKPEVLGVVLPRPAPSFPDLKSTSQPEGTDVDDSIHFQLPANAGPLQRRLAAFLQHQLRLPDLLLYILFAIRLKVWLAAALWVSCAPLAAYLELGPPYVLATITALVFFNLGNRKAGEASAYSIFNQFRRLPGQLTADELDRQLRQGQM